MWDLTESGYHDNKEDSEMDGHAETRRSMAHNDLKSLGMS